MEEYVVNVRTKQKVWANSALTAVEKVKKRIDVDKLLEVYPTKEN